LEVYFFNNRCDHSLFSRDPGFASSRFPPLPFVLLRRFLMFPNSPFLISLPPAGEANSVFSGPVIFPRGICLADSSSRSKFLQQLLLSFNTRPILSFFPLLLRLPGFFSSIPPPQKTNFANQIPFYSFVSVNQLRFPPTL